MATKKQKHQAALERRARFMEALILENKRVLDKERERRKEKILSDWKPNHDKKHSLAEPVKECPHCTIALKKSEMAAVEPDLDAIDLTRTAAPS